MTERTRKRPTGKGGLKTNVEGLQVGDSPRSAKSAKSAKSQTPEPREPQTDDKPKYQTFIRTEARLREDQLDALVRIRRRVTTDREDKSERITDNTLIRIAVDLLVEHADDLSGETEEALRESVTS